MNSPTWKSLALGFLAMTTFLTGTAYAEEQPTPSEQSNDEVPFNDSIGDKDRFADGNFSVEGRFFAPHLYVKIKSDKVYYNGGEVGLKDDLGFGNDNAPEIIFRYKRLSIDYIYLHGTGHKTFSGRDVLTFGGSKFRGHINSKNTLHYIKLSVTNPIKTTEDGGINWSYGLTGMLWKGKVSGQDIRGRSVSKSEDFGAPIPTLGLGVHANFLPQFNAYANVSGLYAGHWGHFYDFEAGVKFKPAPHFAITAGYRKIETKVKHNDDYGKLKMHGPFAGIRVDF